MEVILAKSAGFCYGVRRAVELTEQAAAEGRHPVMLGSVIHNRHVIDALLQKGSRIVSSPEEVESGEAVVIRAHGVGEETYQALEAKGAEIIDGTCPHVRRIQEIARQAALEGRQMVLIGSPSHPEVQGICGWGENVLVFSEPEEVDDWLKNTENITSTPITMAAQTTQLQGIWESSWKLIKKQCTNLKKFDTICSATQKRQTEAAEIAAKVDVMVVVGDRQSANSRHLYELCQERCGRVFLIESADEIPTDKLTGCRRAGLTAGASTPASIIKEVDKTMSEEKIMSESTENFAEMFEQYTNTLHTGDKVTGVVTAITPTEVHVDLGCKQAGYIPMDQLTDDPEAKVEDIVKIGDEVELFVVRVNDVEGYATLSKKRLDANKIWDVLEEAMENKTVVEGVVSEENKGGIVVFIKGARVFVPASQSGLPRDAEMSQLLKQKVQMRITEVNRARRRVVGSIRAVAYEARQAAAAAVWEGIEVGKRYTGTVKSMTSYGVFVDIGGVDGMVHISDLSWSRIKTPAEIVKVGDTLEVYVISFDKEKRKISLGVKDRSMNPWEKFMETYKVGDVANVKIVNIRSFGAFAEVVPGVDGLIHISQIADRRIESPAECLSEGELVDAKIIEVDEEKKKISLSIRALLGASAAGEE
ncbi:MAG: bifunctional 4-hydroxy-3-methylbut-2-enyl diphosphate reductase/30S ribosomal protein S1 [Oscillospiraceae bacterium]|jgi:(E)-4-hydroxy-3-methyl-but-2-enyl pyrophosphate reductase|nr:bifunctional 4-hydroxy-3-methylbut-2-enyl diphosphate reductase/30S ribosomal protein S1 [Oscillospiraceae bacterium]